MRNFVCGALFATGLYLFGQASYELGKIHERERNANLWKALGDELHKIKEELDEATEEEPV